MNAWKQVRMGISRAARGIFHDLFGEGDLYGTSPEAVGRPLSESIQLGPIQAQLDALAPELARLEARQRQAESERARLAAELAALDNEIDGALLRGENEQARQGARRRLELARQYTDLSQRCLEQAKLATDARGVLERMRKRWGDGQRQLAHLTDREQDAAALENIASVRRELETALADLEASLRKQERGV